MITEYKWLIWGSVVLIVGFSAWWHIRENRGLHHALFSLMDDHGAKWVVHFAWSRTIQLFAIMICSIILLSAYELQMVEVQKTLAATKATLAQQEILLKKQSEANEKLKKEAELAAATALPAPPAQPALAPVVAALAPVAEAVPAEPQKVIPPPTDITSAANYAKYAILEPLGSASASLVDDVYNPEKSKNDAQSNMDDIKKRYEDILVIYLFLGKCKKVKQEDHAVIMNALNQEMAQVKAPLEMQNNVLSSAQGAYNEIYSKSACDGQATETLLTQYNDYIKTLARDFPVKH